MARKATWLIVSTLVLGANALTLESKAKAGANALTSGTALELMRSKAALKAVELELMQHKAALKAHKARKAAGPQIGMSLPVHPPKFPDAQQFLAQYAACPAARDAMSLFLVFSDQADADLFKKGLAEVGDGFVQHAYTPVLAAPTKLDPDSQAQFFISHKKWSGIAHILDLKDKAPKYGLMVDAEMTLFDPSDCGTNSEWTRLLGRIEEAEAAKQWPASEVSWPSGDAKITMRQSLKWVNKATNGECNYKQCNEAENAVQKVLFSWWTDLPWMNLKVVKNMLSEVSGKKVPDDAPTWSSLVGQMQFPRFEHVSYQMWTVLHEDFHFNDVTPMVGKSQWGSYLEDKPENHPRVHELKPMWVARAGERTVSKEAPPVLVFHGDKGPQDKARIQGLKKNWRNFYSKIGKKVTVP